MIEAEMSNDTAKIIDMLFHEQSTNVAIALIKGSCGIDDFVFHNTDRILEKAFHLKIDFLRSHKEFKFRSVMWVQMALIEAGLAKDHPFVLLYRNFVRNLPEPEIHSLVHSKCCFLQSSGGAVEACEVNFFDFNICGKYFNFILGLTTMRGDSFSVTVGAGLKRESSVAIDVNRDKSAYHDIIFDKGAIKEHLNNGGMKYIPLEVMQKLWGCDVWAEFVDFAVKHPHIPGSYEVIKRQLLEINLTSKAAIAEVEEKYTKLEDYYQG